MQVVEEPFCAVTVPMIGSSTASISSLQRAHVVARAHLPADGGGRADGADGGQHGVGIELVERDQPRGPVLDRGGADEHAVVDPAAAAGGQDRAARHGGVDGVQIELSHGTDPTDPSPRSCSAAHARACA